MNPADFRLLTYFVEIVSAGSIRGAARRLSLSPAVVSTALSELEGIFGTTLIRRTTRSMALTEAGRALHERARAAVSAVETAMSALDAAAQPARGPVSVTLPVELALAWLPPILRRFEAAHPLVRPVIHADDAPVQLAQSDHDLALRAEYHAAPVGGYDICANFPLELVCAPQAVREAEVGLQDQLDAIGFLGTAQQARDGALGAVHRETRERVSFSVSPRFLVNNQYVGQELARQGFGAALLISASAERDLDAGRLVRLSSDYGFGYVAVRILMRDPLPSAAARAFRRFMLEET